MVINYNNNTEIVNSFNDCTSLLNPEIAEAIEYFHENGDDSDLVQQHKNLQEEFNCYEASNESYHSCLNEVLDVAEKLKEKIEDTKRLNRAEIIEYLENIINTICNEI